MNNLASLYKALGKFEDALPLYKRAFAIGESSVNVSIEDPEKDYTWDSKVPVIERQGKDIEIGLNLSLLEQILKSIDEQEVKWEYVSPISASILTGVNGQEANTLQLIMPIRLEKKDE